MRGEPSNKIKILDLDQDEFPEILAEFKGSGEPSICELYGYLNGNYEEIEIPSKTRHCSDIKVSPSGLITLLDDNKKTIYRYNKGNLSKVLQP